MKDWSCCCCLTAHDTDANGAAFTPPPLPDAGAAVCRFCATSGREADPRLHAEARLYVEALRKAGHAMDLGPLYRQIDEEIGGAWSARDVALTLGLDGDVHAGLAHDADPGVRARAAKRIRDARAALVASAQIAAQLAVRAPALFGAAVKFDRRAYR